ncbi:armadillo repeat-containing protein 8, partial [Tremellales sp. Uapishka_1]
MTSSTTVALLRSAAPGERLDLLKKLKNSVIGNTWKKVEVADDEELLKLYVAFRISSNRELIGISLLSLLRLPSDSSTFSVDDAVNIDVINETAVIVGALATVGAVTLRPLLVSATPTHLLNLIRTIVNLPSNQSLSRLLPPLLRALRNVLVSTADAVWGHMWGVGLEIKVVGTGLLVMESMQDTKGKGAEGKKRGWRVEAQQTLGMLFERNNLTTLLTLLCTQTSPQILLPLYQLFAHLISLPSHRLLLAQWRPSPSSALGLSDPPSSTQNEPFILAHLLNSISRATTSRPNLKLLEAALDLLAALVKGQPDLAALIRSWNAEDDRVGENSEFMSGLVDMLMVGPTNVRIASASCLTNILKSDKSHRTTERVRSTIMNLQLLDVIVKLLKGDGDEERIKLCFILAALVSDDTHLQKSAAEQGCPAQIINLISEVDRENDDGDIGPDVASRSKEATLLALASLSFQHEPTRALVAESPSLLQSLHKSLAHPSYGVRAAACQLARALSRTVAILRTTLVDSGVGDEVVQVLKREVQARSSEKDEEEVLGERSWTVEVAATATICNLVADFSPVRASLLKEGGVELLVDLTKSSHEPIVLNALWALKNLTFHATESVKNQVMGIFTYESLQRCLSPATPIALRCQGFEILQNLVADATPVEISRMVDQLGEARLLDMLSAIWRDTDADVEIGMEMKISAMYVLSNLSLGQEKQRSNIVSRPDILESISNSITSQPDPVKIPALRTLKHLLAPRSTRPRQSIIDVLQPFQLRSRLKDLVEQSSSLDVIRECMGLLDLLDRGKERDGSR